MKTTTTTSLAVAKDIGVQRPLGHGDWCLALLDIEHAAHKREFTAEVDEHALGDVDGGLRACRIAYELLNYVPVDDDDKHKALKRFVEMATVG